MSFHEMTYQQRKDAGLCPTCGREWPGKPSVHCWGCVNKIRFRSRMHRLKRGIKPRVIGVDITDDDLALLLACAHFRARNDTGIWHQVAAAARRAVLMQRYSTIEAQAKEFRKSK